MGRRGEGEEAMMGKRGKGEEARMGRRWQGRGDDGEEGQGRGGKKEKERQGMIVRAPIDHPGAEPKTVQVSIASPKVRIVLDSSSNHKKATILTIFYNFY